MGTINDEIMNKTLFSIIFSIGIISLTPMVFAQYEDTIVVLETEGGTITIEFFPDDAPNHVNNFITLAESGFYEDTFFHRVIPDFMIQGGDPKTKTGGYGSPDEWGTGDPGYSLDAEFNNIKHDRGIVSMARSPDPNSAGSQFFIVHADSHFLDGEYTVFGRIVTQESYDALDFIVNLPTIPTKTIPVDYINGLITKVEVKDRADIENLLELDPPERTSTPIPVLESIRERYVDKELGFAFIAPLGWELTEPPIVDSTTPVVAALGPKIDGFRSGFSVNVQETNMSLEEHITIFTNQLQPMINTGDLEIIEEKNGNISNKSAYIITAIGKQTTNQNETRELAYVGVLVIKHDKLFSLQYVDIKDNLPRIEDDMLKILQTFEILQHEEELVSDTPTETIISDTPTEEISEGGGCLIATAAFGSEMAPQVQFLRELRDNTVLQTQSGTSFMTAFNSFYYSFSPAVADHERENPVFKEAVKLTLTPLLTSLTFLNYVDIDTEQEMLGYGIGVILLNIGMYFVAPAVIIIALKNKIK